MNPEENNVITPVEAAVEQIRKEVLVSGIEVTRVYKSDWQKEGTLTAELKQTVKTSSFYPSKSVSNNMQDNVFGTADFGFTEQVFENEEARFTWIDVPLGSTVESVTAKLAAFPNAVLYRVLSNKPILNDSQIYGITAGLTTKDIIGNRQVVRYPKNHAEEGKLVLDNNGKIQYRQICFKTSKIGDLDQRTAAMDDVYMSAEITAEYTNAGQKVI